MMPKKVICSAVRLCKSPMSHSCFVKIVVSCILGSSASFHAETLKSRGRPNKCASFPSRSVEKKYKRMDIETLLDCRAVS